MERSDSAPSSRADGTAVLRSVVETLRRDWLRARERNRDLAFLSLTRDGLAELDRRLQADGAPRVLDVCRHALGAAERREIQPVFWARMFVGNGYNARALAFDEHHAGELERKRRREQATRPLTDFEQRLLRSYRSGVA